MTGPTVSVLLPTYNRARFIAESLESIFEQSLPPIQVIVINDGSTDETKPVLDRFRDKVEYLECENRGKPTALNLAMPRVTGEYVWIMDDDDVALPDALQRHVAILERRPEVGWTYSSYIDAATGENGRISPQKELPLPDFPQEEFLVRLMENCFLIHPTILVRACCYREMGPFRTDLIRCQDYEMAVRLARRYPSARVPGPTICHRAHAGSRGSAQHTFSADQMYEKWLQYMQIFFRELRKEIPITEYLPGRSGSNGEALDLCHAYLQRMGIMARKRLYAEMFEDLKLAQQQVGEGASLSPADRELLRQTYSSIWDPFFFGKEIQCKIRSVCTTRLGFAIRREFIMFFYWDAIAAIRRRKFSQVIDDASAAMQLAGPGVLRSFLDHRKVD
jgi:glycosyltransferase involved in cell wall biosynthesis